MSLSVLPFLFSLKFYTGASCITFIAVNAATVGRYSTHIVRLPATISRQFSRHERAAFLERDYTGHARPATEPPTAVALAQRRPTENQQKYKNAARERFALV